MITALCLSWAWATEPVAREGQALKATHYARMDLEGGRAHPRWRRKRASTYTAWQWPDGTVQRYRQLDHRALVEERQYDVAGWPDALVQLGPEGPERVTIQLAEPVEIDVSGWSERTTAHATWRLPVQGQPQGERTRFTLQGGRLETWQQPSQDIWREDRFLDNLVASCGCTIEERQPVWLDGRAGLRIRLRAPQLPEDQWADLWAVPLADGVWFASWAVPPTTTPNQDLALGRAAIALLQWREAP